MYAALQLIEALVQHEPAWLAQHRGVLHCLVALWSTPAMQALRRTEADVLATQHRLTPLFVALLHAALRVEPLVEAYMALLDLYPLSPSRDATHHTRFVYEQACVRADVAT